MKNCTKEVSWVKIGKRNIRSTFIDEKKYEWQNGQDSKFRDVETWPLKKSYLMELRHKGSKTHNENMEKGVRSKG